MEAKFFLSSPLDGWSHEGQHSATTVGHEEHTESVFSEDLASAPFRRARSDSGIATRALMAVGAEPVPAEEFWILGGEGRPVTMLTGCDFVVWALPQRPVCAYHHEYRMAVR